MDLRKIKIVIEMSALLCRELLEVPKFDNSSHMAYRFKRVI